jgi:hypothetical protein
MTLARLRGRDAHEVAAFIMFRLLQPERWHRPAAATEP